MSDALRIGIVGFGFMGETHARAYQAAQRTGVACRLVAIASSQFADDATQAPNPASGNIGGDGSPPIDLDGVELGADAHRLFESDRVDAVSICTPTDTHVELARAALRAGKHVLVEKPVATRSSQVELLSQAASDAGLVCMPAMCMRFWPAWSWLKRAVESGEFGAVRHARFERLGSTPTWSGDFYHNESRTGGALFDLHIHDADFVVHLFGPPRAVHARGDSAHVVTSYLYPDGPAVSGEGGWLRGPSFPFRMRYTVEFETAVADFDLSRDPQLEVHLADGTAAQPIDDARAGYDHQAAHFVRAVAGEEPPGVTLGDAAIVTHVLERERQSLDTHGPVTC